MINLNAKKNSRIYEGRKLKKIEDLKNVFNEKLSTKSKNNILYIIKKFSQAKLSKNSSERLAENQ